MEVISIPSSVTAGTFTLTGCPKVREVNIDSGNTTYATLGKMIYSFGEMKTLFRCLPTNPWNGTLLPQITKIGDYGFAECSKIPKEIDLRVFDADKNDVSQLTAIGQYAFLGCTELESVVMPKTVTSIGTWAFKNCPKLKSVIMHGDAPNGGGMFGSETEEGYPKDCIVYYYAGTKGWKSTYGGRPTQEIAPVVFLHGYNGNAAGWNNMINLLVSDPNRPYPRSMLHALEYGNGGIDVLARDMVAPAIKRIYEQNGNHPVDVVAHSMGGIILRSALAQGELSKNHVRRFIPIATPHYGQNIGTMGVSIQASQMNYGSEFLWNLAKAWHFEDKKLDDANVLCIAGLENITDDWYWDGLVQHWSAALGDTTVRYVYRSHADVKIFGFDPRWFDAPVIYHCTEGFNDAVYALVKNFLTTGKKLSEGELLQSPIKGGAILPSYRNPGGTVFLQVVNEQEEPVTYHGPVVDGLLFGCESGVGQSARQKGIELVTDARGIDDIGLATGKYNFTINSSKGWKYQVNSSVPAEVKAGRVTVLKPIKAELAPMYVLSSLIAAKAKMTAIKCFIDIISPLSLDWTAVSDSPWLTLETTSGTGNGLLGYSIQENKTTSERIGTITISYTYEGKLKHIPVTVVQDSASTSGTIYRRILASANSEEGGAVTGGGLIKKGASCTLTAIANNGYSFVNWMEGSTVVSTQANYTFKVTDSRTLTANFMPVGVLPCTVTFNGSGGAPDNQSVIQVHNNKYILPPFNPTRTGYKFAGWFTSVLGGEQITTNTTVLQTLAHTLFAHWDKVYTLTVKSGTADVVSSLSGAVVEVRVNDAPLNQEFQKWTMSPTSTAFAEGFSINDATTKIIMPAANVTMTAVYVKAPGSLGIECVPNNGQTVAGVEWSTDKKTWYAADVTQRLTSGAYTVYFRSTDGKWIVPASTKITLNAGSADSPTLVPVNCEFAPAFDGDILYDATDPNSDQGQWNEESGQLDWTGLRVGLRAKLGPLPLQANATSVKLKGGKLPTGLKLVTIDGQVYLSGIPTKAGTYPAVLQAMEGKKAGTLLPVVWTVQDLPAEYIGTFNGVYTATTNDITRHSALTLTVAKTGKMTGSVTLGGKKYSLKADAFDAIDYATEAMSVTNAAFICTSPKLTNAVSLTISLSEAGLGMFEVTPLPTATGDYTGQAVRNGWKDKVKHALRVTAVDTVSGYYTLSLYPEDDSYGAGYVTLTVDAKGGVKAAGKLADGTAVSGSGVLLVTDEDISTVIALTPSAYKGGEFYLNVKFIQDAQPGVDAAEPVNWVNTVTTTTSNGPFERKPEVKGGWYSQLTSLYSVYGTSYDPENPYKLGLNVDAITTAVSMQFNAKGTEVDALSKTNNPYNVKLTLTPKTGLFSGSFNETGIKTAYKLYGILTPYLVTDTDDTAGLGFYSIPMVVPKTQRSELFRLTTEAVEE